MSNKPYGSRSLRRQAVAVKRGEPNRKTVAAIGKINKHDNVLVLTTPWTQTVAHHG